ncbi:hypothetical protein LJR219_000718 [Phenylobacterium sp. LjRoot219]|uniref:aspartyl protease family protein n=1 Tax=Phenylobacterium sp. LjRoot219 TaxID=3342283 RepID=UPI003ECEEF7A
MRPSALLLAVTALWPLAARAGETACWYEAGVLVVPAEVMGVAGDFVLDTGAPRTLLAETQAQGAGYAETELKGSVRLAGLELADRPVQVMKLDARLRPLPTPVAGVIGADVLAGRVLDVQFAPCRVAITAAGEAPSFGPAVRLPLTWRSGRPTAPAEVSDGARVLGGDFVLATGSDAAVRLRDDLADAPGAAEREALYPDGAVRPRLRALSFAGDLFEAQPSGLASRAELDAVGEIGGPVLSHYRLRFDFAGGELLLAKQKGPPDRSDGP